MYINAKILNNLNSINFAKHNLLNNLKKLYIYIFYRFVKTLMNATKLVINVHLGAITSQVLSDVFALMVTR